MNRITTLLAAGILAVGATAAFAQSSASPDEGTETSKGAARQTKVDKGMSPSDTKTTTGTSSKKMTKSAKKKMKK